MIDQDAQLLAESELFGELSAEDRARIVQRCSRKRFGSRQVIFHQFEVGRENVGKGGIVSNSEATQRAEAAFIDWLAEQGWTMRAATDSPIKGGDGNAERLIFAERA